MKYIVKILFIFFLSSHSLAIDIEESIKSTIENNSKVKIAIEKIEESKELINYAIGSKLPKVTGTVSGTYSTADTTTTTSSTTPETLTDAYKLTISQNLYNAGINDLEIERSKILFNNELIYFKSTIQDLILDAINGYLTVINYQKFLQATQKNYDSVLKAFQETKTRFDLGSATLYDLQNAEASFAISTTNLFAAEQNIEISKKSFERIVGLRPVDLVDILKTETIISLNDIINRSMEDNLDLILISNDIKDKEILLLKEKKSKQPSLDISASGVYSNGSRLEKGTETTSGSIDLTLTIPLFQKGQDDSNIRKYQSQLLQSKMNLLDSQEDLKILISNRYKDFQINQSKMKSNLIIIRSIETSINSLKAEYDIGTKTITDLINEEEKLLNANVNFLNSKKDFILNYFILKSLDGGLIKLFEKYLPSFN